MQDGLLVKQLVWSWKWNQSTLDISVQFFIIEYNWLKNQTSHGPLDQLILTCVPASLRPSGLNIVFSNPNPNPNIDSVFYPKGFKKLPDFKNQKRDNRMKDLLFI